VEAGLRRYQERPDRYEYHPTWQGLDPAFVVETWPSMLPAAEAVVMMPALISARSQV
jgi:hypothetical protein